MSLIDDLFNQIPEDTLKMLPSKEEYQQAVEEYRDFIEHVGPRAMFLMMIGVPAEGVITSLIMAGVLEERKRNETKQLTDIYGNIPDLDEVNPGEEE